MAEEIARRLGINGYSCEYIMGDLPQSKRLQVIDALKAGKLSLLVATDVAARGLDVNALDMVINYDLPMDPESYVHRIGRTARAGAAGKAISMACEKFVYGLPAIEKYIETKIPVMPVTEELFGADKSSGMRFGHARERGRPGDERGERRPIRTASRDGRGRDARDNRGREASRPVESRGRGPAAEGRGRNPGTGVRAQEARPAERRPAESRGTPPGATGAKHGKPADGNPYAVSAEERMRRYKAKYATGAAPGGTPGPESKGNAGQDRSQGHQREVSREGLQDQGQGRNRGREAGSRVTGGRGPQGGRGSQSQPRQASGNGRGNQQGNQQGNRPAGQGGRGNGQVHQAAPSAVASGQTGPGTKKPGILDKLKSLFGKKKPE